MWILQGKDRGSVTTALQVPQPPDAIAQAYWFIARNTNFGGEHFLIKTLKKTWVKEKLTLFFTQFRENTF